jgi:adenylate kinase
MQHKNFVLILGAQSSGKSTQAKLLADYIGYKFISSGKLLRRLSEADNPIGKKLSAFWIKGDLVPDEFMEEILYPILEKEDAKGFVLDGYPRNVEQLKDFLGFLDMKDWLIIHVFYFDVTEEECMRRIKIRAETEKRLDETEDAIKTRLKIYHQETEPLLSEYEKMGVLRKIDGEKSIEDIQSNLQTYFAAKERSHS